MSETPERKALEALEELLPDCNCWGKLKAAIAKLREEQAAPAVSPDVPQGARVAK